MRLNDKGEVIITGKKASELFNLIQYASVKLNGKAKTQAEKYHKELQEVLFKKWGISQ